MPQPGRRTTRDDSVLTSKIKIEVRRRCFALQCSEERPLPYMNLKHFEHRLRLKQHELLSSLAGSGTAGSAAGEPAVEEGIDVSSLLATSESPKEGCVLSQTLAEVQYALGRLGDDSYDKCVDCGNPIEATRLKAIPWTLYCLADQQKRDLKKSPAKQYPGGLPYSQSA